MFLYVLEFELKFKHFYVDRSTILGIGKVPGNFLTTGAFVTNSSNGLSLL